MTMRELLIIFKKNIFLILIIMLISMVVFLGTDYLNKNFDNKPKYYTLNTKYAIEVDESVNNRIETKGKIKIDISKLGWDGFKQKVIDNKSRYDVNSLHSISAYYDKNHIFVETICTDINKGRETISLFVNTTLASDYYENYIKNYNFVSEEYIDNSSNQYQMVFYMLYIATSIYAALMLVLFKEIFLKR